MPSPRSTPRQLWQTTTESKGTRTHQMSLAQHQTVHTCTVQDALQEGPEGFLKGAWARAAYFAPEVRRRITSRALTLDCLTCIIQPALPKSRRLWYGHHLCAPGRSCTRLKYCSSACHVRKAMLWFAVYEYLTNLFPDAFA
eukprot:445035-Amphidinium_carterae.1